MNTAEANLLTRTDRMSESGLTLLSGQELAQLRAALLHQLEETLYDTLMRQTSRVSGVAAASRFDGTPRSEDRR